MAAANPAIRRLTSEAKELERDPDPDFTAGPLGDDLLIWHFTIRGAPDSVFAGGLYHGKIIFPPQYPLNPPDITFLTPNGRWETGRAICLTFTSYHPEEWNPAWSVRTVLTSLIAFMQTPAEGAVGGIDLPDRERRVLAAQSRSWHCPEDCGCELEPLPGLPGAEPPGAEPPGAEPPAEEPPAPEVLWEEEEEESGAADQPAPPQDAAIDDDFVHVNYDDLRALPLKTLPMFMPMIDVPIIVLFLLVLVLIANWEHRFIPVDRI